LVVGVTAAHGVPEVRELPLEVPARQAGDLRRLESGVPEAVLAVARRAVVVDLGAPREPGAGCLGAAGEPRRRAERGECEEECLPRQCGLRRPCGDGGKGDEPKGWALASRRPRPTRELYTSGSGAATGGDTQLQAVKRVSHGRAAGSKVSGRSA